MARTRKPFTVRTAAVCLAVFWTVAAALYVAYKHSASEVDSVQTARACMPAEYFTTSSCQVTLSGKVTTLSHDSIGLEVEGQTVTMPIAIVGDVSKGSGRAAAVSFYEGSPIRVESSGLRIDAKDSPARNSDDYLHGATFFFVVGPILVLANLVTERFRRRRSATS